MQTIGQRIVSRLFQSLGSPARYAKEFDEAEHPRDEAGRFTESGRDRHPKASKAWAKVDKLADKAAKAKAKRDSLKQRYEDSFDEVKRLTAESDRLDNATDADPDNEDLYAEFQKAEAAANEAAERHEKHFDLFYDADELHDSAVEAHDEARAEAEEQNDAFYEADDEARQSKRDADQEAHVEAVESLIESHSLVHDAAEEQLSDHNERMESLKSLAAERQEQASEAEQKYAAALQQASGNPRMAAVVESYRNLASIASKLSRMADAQLKAATQDANEMAALIEQSQREIEAANQMLDDANEPDKYARAKHKSLAGQGEFRWITIGGEAIEGKGNHHGGTHVQIRGSTGEIVSGPSALEGKKVGELGKSSHANATVRGVRKTHAERSNTDADSKKPDDEAEHSTEQPNGSIEAVLRPGTQAEKEDTPDAKHSTILDKYADHSRQIDEGTATADQVRQWFAESQSPEEVSGLKAELGKKTVAQLKGMGAGGFHAGDMKKGELIDNLIRRIQGQYHVGDSITHNPFEKGSYEKALKTAIDSQTDEDIKRHSEQRSKAIAERNAHREKIINAIKNPQTLEDFETRQRFAKDKTLTPEMQERYDELVGTTRKAKEAEKASTVHGVTGVSGLTAEIKEGFHAKKQKPTYVAVINQRVERDKYTELLNAAKKLGGYYSAFRGSGAIPGFQFESMDAAEKFRDIVHGNNVDRSDILEERQESKSESRASTLRERADSISTAAEDDLNRDRKTNTRRRADMTASIDARNRAKIAQAETMKKIADEMESGKLKHLDGVRAATHVDQLDSLLSRAKQNAIRAMEKTDEGKQWSYNKRESEWNREPSQEDIAHAEYPYPRIWSSELIDAGKKLADVPGLKNAARTLEGIGKQAISAKFATQGNGIKFSGGSRLDPNLYEGLERIAKSGKHIRIHQTYDHRLVKQNDWKAVHTADNGRTWGTTPETAVAGAIRAGSDLDLVDPPHHQSVQLTTEKEIDALAQVASKLKNHTNRDLRRLGESAAGEMAKYNRMQQMGIKSLPELRAALREFHGLRSESKKEDPVKIAERKLIGRKIDGFFPTPKTIVDRMLDEADIRPGMSVLEPSAGKGDILDMIRDRYGDSVKTHAIEPSEDLREIIGLKGHDVGGWDFLEENGKYDRIVMNPPFENSQDIQHVKHAFDRLNPGGKLVALVTNGGGKKREDFDKWVQDNDGMIENLPEKSFATSEAFRQTGVNTRMVVIEKPNADPEKYSKEDSPDRYSAFNEADHPRGEGGLFESTGSATTKPAPGVAGQQQSLFGGKAPAGGQQSLFNVVKPVAKSKPKEVAAKIAGRIGELLAGKETVSPADLTIPVQGESLPGQKTMFARPGNATHYEARWVTLGKKGDDHRPRIQIEDDGSVKKGPPALLGENLGDKSRNAERRAKAVHAAVAGKTGRDLTAAKANSLAGDQRMQQYNAAKQAAKVAGVSTGEVLKLLPEAQKYLQDQSADREKAKARARTMTGMTAGRIASIENAHRDWSTVPGFDERSRDVASEHPELGFDPDDSDTPAKVWDLIREGAGTAVALHSTEVAELAASWAKPVKTKPKDDWDSVPFSRSPHDL